MFNMSDGVKKALILIPTQPLPASTRVALRRKHLANLELAKAHRASFLIIGHPKSGNTWLKAMISRLYQIRYDLPESKLINTDEFARKIRISARAFHTHRFLAPQLRRMAFIDRFKYFSRKLLRWFGGLFLVAGCLSAALTVALVSVPLLVALLACTALLVWRGLASQRGRIASIFEIILALTATQIGVFQAMFGRTFSVWEPAARRLPDEDGTAVETVDKAPHRPTPAE